MTSHPCISVSVLNLHEDERQKPENWIPIGWMPNYDKDLTKRSGKGYESDQARKVRLFHDCFRHLLSNWDLIIHLIKVILRKFYECVETALDQYGLAAKRLGQRFQLMLAKRNGRDGQRYVL